MDLQTALTEAWTWVTGHPGAVATIAGLLIGLIGLLYTHTGGRDSRKSLALAESQALANLPAVDVQYLSGTCSIGKHVRLYIFDLVISNASDRNNSLSRAELWLDYKISSDRMVTTKVGWTAESSQKSDGGSRPLLLPINLGARETRAGQLQIAVPRQVLTGRSIDRLRLVIEDSFKIQHVTSTAFVQEAYIDTHD